MVILRVFVGNLTGPVTASFLSFAPLINSLQTEKMKQQIVRHNGNDLINEKHLPLSKLLTLVLVSVIRILWMAGWVSSTGFCGSLTAAYVALIGVKN